MSSPATPRGNDTGTTRRFAFTVTVLDARLAGAGWTATSTITSFVGTQTGTILPTTNAYSSNSHSCGHAAGKVSVNAVPTVVHTSTGPCNSTWTVHFDVHIPESGLVADSYIANVAHVIAVPAIQI